MHFRVAGARAHFAPPSRGRPLLGVVLAATLAALSLPGATLAENHRPGAPSAQPLADKAGCRSAKAAPAPGIARWLEDCGQVDPKAAPEAAARSVIAPRAAQLGLRRDGRDIALIKTDRTARATYVRFQQTHVGVPVFNGQLVVQYDWAGRVQLINNHTLPELAGVDTNPAIRAAEAVAAAQAEVDAEELRLPAQSELVIFGDHGTSVLAWHVTLYTQQPLHDWHAMVSARSGKVVASWDALAHDSGTGQAYHPNAIQQSGTTTLSDANDANSPALQSARVSLALNNLTSGVETLKGSYVDTTAPGVSGCNLPYTPGSARSAIRVYDYTRDDDRFEEVVAYAAIDGVQTWFQSLGFTNVNNRSVPIDVHCTSDDNSFYSSSDKALHMGDGGVDDGEDADIVIHEYGHSVHDNQVPGWGGGNVTEQRAMGEGFGDFLAGIYYVGDGNSTYMASYRYCIGEWDAASYNPVSGPANGSGCLRWINGRSQTNGSDIGAYGGTPTHVHSDGRYWSAALTCMYEGMGANGQARDDVMKILLASHFSLTPDGSNTAFEDAVDALIAADETYLGGVNRMLIGNCALDRGLISSLPVPVLPTPTVTVPADGGSYPVGSVLAIEWNANGAPSSATYTLEYTSDCVVVPSFADTMETGTNGWATAHVGGTADWALVTTDAHSATNSWFAGSLGSVNDQYLVSPPIALAAGSELSFWHRYDMESGYDGGVVEVSTNGGASWTDLGSAITQNGYDAAIATGFSSPIAGRSAFTGDSSGWIETRADLSSYAGQTVSLRFRQADDSSTAELGWWIDDVVLSTPASWSAIATTGPGATSHEWTTPVDAGTNYCVRIRGAADGYNDSSHDVAGPFSLVAVPPGLPECTEAPFSDVATDHEFCPEITWMKAQNISTGYQDGTYRPALAVTRMAMSAFMARLAGADPQPCTTAPFNDVSTTHPFCAEITWMKDQNISTGYGDGTYRPSANVTRMAMSAFMARLAGASLQPCTEPPFDDVSTTHPFCSEIQWMRDSGVSTGFEDGTYRPAHDVTRMAMSAFMYRVSAKLP